ncbi:MAG: LLM class flavin-dependent oxidoreductase [Nitrososphaerota archaeon]|nr:LLM class flavin-dependent oxidoreductase [Nitrososphaerota archaeon]
MLFGGKGPRMLNLAGKHADICFIAQEKPEDFLAAKAEVTKASGLYGRPSAPSFACFVELSSRPKGRTCSENCPGRCLGVS